MMMVMEMQMEMTAMMSRPRKG